jgi:glycerol-3-phosphate dehydrogenase
VSAEFDVVVIGAGIHGAGAAQAAAVAGHRVLVLEQTGIAAGTSSRSSKLIHGGLRYLETYQFRLVRECLRERAVLLAIAPDLVKLQRFHIPVYPITRRRPWLLTTGLSIYAALAGMDSTARWGRIPRSQWDTLDGLDTEELQDVFWYQDGQTDDRLLSQAVMRSAQSIGAELALPARLTGATLEDDGVVVQYETPRGSEECRARVLINAAGPWADGVARTIKPAVEVPAIERVQGSHIVIDGTVTQGIYYVESPRDGRAIFVMPWQGRTMIGTTEVRFQGDPARVEPTASELRYLQWIARRYFPRFRTPAADAVVSSFAGLRVLPTGSGHAFHRSRETLLVPDRPRSPRVLSIYGGKLTSYRAVSEQVIARVSESLPERRPIARTDQMMLSPVST